MAGLQDMLSVAADAQLQGGSAGIDASNLVDALDTMRRLAFALGNLTHQCAGDDPVMSAIRRSPQPTPSIARCARAWIRGWRTFARSSNPVN